jgi:PD-(D/E)XK endonuclease
MSQWANQIGAAGEHIVCADLLLLGYRAMLAAATLPYDVLVDVKGRLLRVAVKSTAKPVPRPTRPHSKWRYSFSVQRRMRLSTGKMLGRDYTDAEIDMLALVALDIRRVAYVPFADYRTRIWLEADTALGTANFGPKGCLIAGFSDYPFERIVNGQ